MFETGFGPAYAGDEFLRLKEIPPAVVAARTSGRFPFETLLDFLLQSKHLKGRSRESVRSWIRDDRSLTFG